MTLREKSMETMSASRLPSAIGWLAAFFVLSMPIPIAASSPEPADLFVEAPGAGRVESAPGPRSLVLFRVDSSELSRRLDFAPLESGQGSKDALVIALPDWDGGRHRFAFVRTSILADSAAAEFPEIRTFRGVGLDRPDERADLVLWDSGFSGMVLAKGRSTRIDSDRDDPGLSRMTRYLPGSKPSGTATVLPFYCSTPQDSGIERIGEISREEISMSSDRREIRVALSATPSFYNPLGSRAHTVRLMASLLSQASMIFEQQLGISLRRSAIRLQLPECSTPADLVACQQDLFTKNQSYLDHPGVLGPDGYDLGHAFSKPCGTGDCNASAGLSGVGVCGSPYYKAYGVTTGAPDDPDATGWDSTRDRFFHAFLHEMGHQLGAQHTFHASDSYCEGSVNALTAFEPLGGSTIMSYAGRCLAPDTLQCFPDLYFHADSLESIRNHVSTASGSGCGQVLSSISPPQFAPTGTPERITIPKGMAFALEKSATGGNVTYTWEQHDYGAPPLFRSFPAEAAERRTFPKDPAHPEDGELPPPPGGTMNFWITARNGQGGFAFSKVEVVVDPLGPFQIDHPSPLARWLSGTQRTVVWSFDGTAPLSTVRCDPPTVSLEIPGRAPILLAGVQSFADGVRVQLPPGLPNLGANLLVQCGTAREFEARSEIFQLVSGAPSWSPVARFSVATLVSAYPQVVVKLDPRASSDLVHLVDTYRWTIDGEQIALPSPTSITHSFSSPGRYPAELSLLNDEEVLSTKSDIVVIPEGIVSATTASGHLTLHIASVTQPEFCQTTAGAAQCNFPANACGQISLVVFRDSLPSGSGLYHLSLGGGATFANGSTEKDSLLVAQEWEPFNVNVPCP